MATTTPSRPLDSLSTPDNTFAAAEVNRGIFILLMVLTAVLCGLSALSLQRWLETRRKLEDSRMKLGSYDRQRRDAEEGLGRLRQAYANLNQEHDTLLHLHATGLEQNAADVERLTHSIELIKTFLGREERAQVDGLTTHTPSPAARDPLPAEAPAALPDEDTAFVVGDDSSDGEEAGGENPEQVGEDAKEASVSDVSPDGSVKEPCISDPPSAGSDKESCVFNVSSEGSSEPEPAVETADDHAPDGNNAGRQSDPFADDNPESDSGEHTAAGES